jgi:hypothetical protein
MFLTLYFCTLLATGPCVAVHPPAIELHDLRQCRWAGEAMSRDWRRRHPGFAAFGGSCDAAAAHFRNEMPWN